MADLTLNDLRPEVAAFALAMEERLRANDHKGGWKRCSQRYLFNGILGELHELHAAWDLEPGAGELRFMRASRIRAEAADLANYSMMLADVCGALQPLEQGGEKEGKP